MIKRTTVNLLTVFAVYTGIMALARMLFMCVYAPSEWSMAQWMAAAWHGLPMDMSVAGYLSALPGLIMAASPWWHKPSRAILKVYYAVTATIIAAVTVLDIALYGYWGFRLDSTPLFYFFSSPSSALASAEWWQAPAGAAAAAVLGYGIYRAVTAVGTPADSTHTSRVRQTVFTLLMTGLLFIPIRGGLTVSTMNISHAYFSADRRLNHAAINPAFSLLYSLTHSDDFASQYRFMDNDEAVRLLDVLNSRSDTAQSDSTDTVCPAPLLNTQRPDICLIILESFSAHLMPSLGGDSIAMRLDSIAANGILFTRFYASSFRTDRALPAILNAFPAQPSTSLMKFVEKAENLPSLAQVLRQNGYATKYYYGGDANFTNMKALLVNAGFDPIVSDSDFPIAEKAGKWGAHDGVLVRRVLEDAAATSADAPPQFIVVQTSSSHEPFHVPYSDARFANHPAKNAFAYADSCMASLVRGMEALPRGRRTLFVIVPDHLGAWPLGLDDNAARHHVPLVLAGPALACAPMRNETIGCQPDIAPTILAALGIDASTFKYGHDLMDTAAPHYAFFSEPGLITLITESDTASVDCDATAAVSPSTAESTAKAYLQRLYDDISKL